MRVKMSKQPPPAPTTCAVGPCPTRGGRVVRWCWVNFQCRGVLLIWIRVGQGPTALAVGAGGGCLDIFILIYPFSPLSPSLWETARYRLKYCLKGPLNPKQPTNQPCPTLIQIVGRPGTGSLPSTRPRNCGEEFFVNELRAHVQTCNSDGQMDEESLEKTSNGQRDVSDVKIEFETIHVHTSDSERVAAEPISHIAEMDVGWLFWV